MISVITPVYNASRFLNKTIQSVLMQKEVSEYIIIDDGSTDVSWKIIELWKVKDKRIIALQHPDCKNHGRSATRNIGIRAAKGKYIAFLDADDFYLPNRFSNDLFILENDISVDGVYNAIGAHFYQQIESAYCSEIQLTTVKNKVSPEELFEVMAPLGKGGWFSCDGLIVRISIFKMVGLFNENLVVAEDTELWFKMAAKATLVSGVLDKPVSIRGVHGNNVFNNSKLYRNYQLKMLKCLFLWGIDNNIGLNRILLVWDKRNQQVREVYPNRKGDLILLLYSFLDIIKSPILLKSKIIREFPFELCLRISRNILKSVSF